VAACPDATLEELQAWLAEERKVTVSIGCLWNRLKFLKLPLKKSRSEPPNKSGRTSPQRAETSAATDVARPLRPLSARRAPGLSDTLGTLEDDDLRGRAAAG
jgi:hypothetical protein